MKKYHIKLDNDELLEVMAEKTIKTEHLVQFYVNGKLVAEVMFDKILYIMYE